MLPAWTGYDTSLTETPAWQYPRLVVPKGRRPKGPLTADQALRRGKELIRTYAPPGQRGMKVIACPNFACNVLFTTGRGLENHAAACRPPKKRKKD